MKLAFVCAILTALFSAPLAFAGSDFMMDLDALTPAPTAVPTAAPTPTPPPTSETLSTLAAPTPPRPSPSPAVRVPPTQNTKPKIVPREEDRTTEASINATCPSCSAWDRNIRDLQALVRGQMRMGDLTTWKRSRGLVEVPTKGSRGNIGPCGSFHYNPGKDKKGVTDSYANPTTACAFMSLLQDWKKKCPSNGGCRVAWGDISHRDHAHFPPHSTHRDGTCIDIRPMRKGRFVDNGLTYGDSDRGTTKSFIELAKSKGANLIYYNDPRTQGGVVREMGGHSNHMHVCLAPNKKTKEVCQNYKYDPKVCEAN